LPGWARSAARFRWAFLPASVAGAALLFAFGSPYRFTHAQFVIAVALFLILVVPLLASSSRPRPALLLAAPQGLATPLDLGMLAYAVTCTLLVGISLSAVDRWTWPWWNVAGTVALLLAVSYLWLRALRWSGVRLDPDGIRYRRIRTRFVPWQAAPELVPLPRSSPATAVLRPGNWKIRLTVDPSYLAAAIQEYVAHPEHRPDLGSTMELTRLSALLSPTRRSTDNQQPL
jgi:hypothetical protein